MKCGGDYDYCRVPGTRQLSPLEVGDYNSKFEPKREIFKYINFVNQKVVRGLSGHAESISGLYFVLTLLIHRFWPLFSPNTWRFFSRFSLNDWFWIKLGSQIARNIRPGEMHRICPVTLMVCSCSCILKLSCWTLKVWCHMIIMSKTLVHNVTEMWALFLRTVVP